MADVAYTGSSEVFDEVDRFYVSAVPTAALMAELELRDDPRGPDGGDSPVPLGGALHAYQAALEMRLSKMQDGQRWSGTTFTGTSALAMGFVGFGVLTPLSEMFDFFARQFPAYDFFQNNYLNLSGLIAVVAVGAISPVLVGKYRALREKRSEIIAQKNLLAAVTELREAAQRRAG